MAKHDNYDNPCVITITKKCHIGGGCYYSLKYEQEDYEFICSKDELLAELGEHLDNMKSERR